MAEVAGIRQNGTLDGTIGSSTPNQARPPPPPSAAQSTSFQAVTMKQKLMALSALGTISTAVGFFTKRSQVGGRYKFHPASAVVCTETFKLVVSLAIIVKMIWRREVGGKIPTEEDDSNEETPVPSPSGEPSMSVGEFIERGIRFLRQEISLPMIIHTAGLALSYSVVNIVTYAIFVHASGSMFYLLKASSPVVTALLLYIMVNRHISKPQWVAVFGQCVGLLATQVNPCALIPSGVAAVAMSGAPLAKATVMSMTGYVLILINIAISCTAGVWNDHVVKTYGASVNAQNVVLYSWGILINYSLFLWAPPSWMGVSPNSEIPTFFEGYNIPVMCVICANGSVGLVITAVYKYADVVVKTFGLAGSTVALFLMELGGLIPGTGKGAPLVSTIMGASVVFYAAYLYILPKESFAVAVPQQASGSNSSLHIPSTWHAILKSERVRRLLYLVGITAGVALFYFYAVCPRSPTIPLLM